MRLFVQLENGVPKAWPLVGDNVRYLAPPNVSFPAGAAAYEEVDLSEFGFETFVEASQPVFDPLTQEVVEATPLKVGSDWQRQWTVASLDATTASNLLASAKAAKWEAIKAKRDSLQSDGGVNVGGKWFLSNDREQGRYNSLIAVATAMGLADTAVLRAAWRTMRDGVTQDMTAALARSILSAGFSQFAATDDAAMAHKAAMEASADPAVYDFSAGWPPTFPG